MENSLPLINIVLTLITGMLFIFLYIRKNTIEDQGVSKYLLNGTNMINISPLLPVSTKLTEQKEPKIINQYCGSPQESPEKEGVDESCENTFPPTDEQWISCEEAKELRANGDSSVCDSMFKNRYCVKSCDMCDKDKYVDEEEEEGKEEDVDDENTNEITAYTFTPRIRRDVQPFLTPYIDVEPSDHSILVGCDEAKELMGRGFPETCNELLARGYCINTCLEPC
jgi:hypothetical protein